MEKQAYLAWREQTVKLTHPPGLPIPTYPSCFLCIGLYQLVLCYQLVLVYQLVLLHEFIKKLVLLKIKFMLLLNL